MDERSTSQEKDTNDLVEDATPLTPTSSGLQQGEPGVELSPQGAVAFHASSQGNAQSQRGPTALAATPMAGQQSGLPSQSPGNIGGSATVSRPLTTQMLSHGGDAGDRKLISAATPQPWRESVGQGSGDDDQSGDKCLDDDESLRNDLRKGIEKAVAQRLEPFSDQEFDSLKKEKKTLSPNDITDEDIKKYRNKFPKYLKTDYFDAMIIYEKDSDQSQVDRFLQRVRTEVLLNQKEKPLVVLFDEVFANAGMNPIKQLDDSLPYCTYVFLYVTKSFCVDGWTEFSSQTCLMDAILTPEKRWSVVPIFTEPKRRPTYRVPPSVRSLKGIQYWSEDKFYADSLRKLLEDKLEVRLERAEELKHKRKLWIIEEKSREIAVEERREQELQLKQEEEETKRKLQQMALQGHMHTQRERHMFKLQDPQELQKMKEMYTPTSPDDYPRYLKEVIPSMSGMSPTKCTQFLSMSASEPADLSELGKKRYPCDPAQAETQHIVRGHGQYAEFPSGPVFSSHQNLAHHPASMQGWHHFSSDPRMQYGQHPAYGGSQVPSGYYSWSGYSQGSHLYSSLDDSVAGSHQPLFPGFHLGPMSTSPHQSHPVGMVHPRGSSTLGRSSPQLDAQRYGSLALHSNPAHSISPQSQSSGQYMGGGTADKEKNSPSPVVSSQDHRGASLSSETSGVHTSVLAARTLQPKSGQEEDFHSLPAGVGLSIKPPRDRQGQESECDVSGQPAIFSSLPPELNTSPGGSVPTSRHAASEVPPLPGKQTTQAVGSGAGSAVRLHDTSQQERIPPLALSHDTTHEGRIPPHGQSLAGKNDLEEDYPSASYQSGMSQVQGGMSYDARCMQHVKPGLSASSMVPGSIAENVLYTQGAGHHSDARIVNSRSVQGGYVHPQAYGHQYGPSPYPQYIANPVPFHGHSYPPYSHAHAVPPQYYSSHSPYTPPPPVYNEVPPPQASVNQVHYHYYQRDSEREHVPQVINIGKAENLMMGEHVEMNVEKSRKGRQRFIVAPPPYDPGAPEVYMDEPKEQFLSGDPNIGEREEMLSRGGGFQSNAGSVTPSSNNPGSRLTAMVTPDQSRPSSNYPLNNDQAGSLHSSRSAYRDLPTGIPGVVNHLEPATYPSGNTAMTRPVGYASPMSQGADSWRQSYDTEHETKLKVVDRGSIVDPAQEDEGDTFVKRPQ